jgi:hypothetical protein
MEATIISRLESLEKKHLRLRLTCCAILLALAVAMLVSFKSPKEIDPEKAPGKDAGLTISGGIPIQRLTKSGFLIYEREDMGWEEYGVRDDNELAILIPGLP